MCNLLRASTKKKIQGYKVVARKLKGKRYYSIAMGFKYPLDGHIPIVRKQSRISSDFADNILTKESVGYKDNMVGRTAVFLEITVLLSGDGNERIRRWKSTLKKGYELVIVLVEISEDLMIGMYGKWGVVAGRHIRFIEETNCL